MLPALAARTNEDDPLSGLGFVVVGARFVPLRLSPRPIIHETNVGDIVRKALARTLLAAFGICATGAALAASMTEFIDPAENAFQLQMPTGWSVEGGTQRFSPTSAGPWVTALSPDHATFVFLGDPSVPIYEQPNPAMMINEGTWITGASGLVAVTPYLPGQQFAALYAQHAMTQTCANLKWQGGQDRPDLVQVVLDSFAQHGDFQPPGQQVDAGSVLYSCDIEGQPFSASVTAVTVFDPLPSGGGIWFVQSLYGYRTPSGGEADAQALIDTIHASFTDNPQWDAQMSQAIQQRGAEIRQAEQEQADRFSAQLSQEGQQLADTMAGRQASYMATMSQQEEDRNNSFNDHMRQKAWGQFNEMLYINDQHCVWNDAHTACTAVQN